MGNCGSCKYWNVNGFGHRKAVTGNEKVAAVGRCDLVAREWYPPEEDKMIALIHTEYAGYPGASLIRVITRREFGCNQFASLQEEKDEDIGEP